MSNRIDTESNYSSEVYKVDLAFILAAISKCKMLMTVVVLVSLFISLAYFVQLPDVYKSDALLAPSFGENGSNYNFNNQIGGLASLAGIKVGGSSSADPLSLALEIVKTRVFVKQFIDKYEVGPQIYATKGWDEAKKYWEYDSTLYDPEKKTWVGAKVGDHNLYKSFLSNLDVRQLKGSGMVMISYTSYSPKFAQFCVEKIVRELNEYVREDMVHEAQNKINYLEEQIAATNISQMQGVFYSLIEQQLKTIMLASARDEYVLKTVDPAVVPERKQGPNRVFGVFLSSSFAFVFAVLFVVVREIVRFQKLG